MFVKLVYWILLLSPVCVNAQNGIITTFAGTGISGFDGDGGSATSAKISGLTTGAFDSYGNFYFAQRGEHKIRKVSTSGIINTIAGIGSAGFSGDGGSATLAQLNNPLQVAIDGNDNLYVADLNNSRVRKIDLSTNIISTIAGNGINGHAGNGGLAIDASLDGPTGVCIDPSGNVYISEISSHTIRKVNLTGIISTYGGTAYVGSDGADNVLATSSSIGSPQSICSDRHGNIYIATASKVRKIMASTRIITSIAGGNMPGYSGDGGPATSSLLNSPWSVAVDKYDNVFIADGNNNTIRHVDLYGYIHSIIGNGIPGYSGDGGNAKLAQISQPEGVTVDSCGNIYVCDLFNYRIRKVTFPKCGYLEVKDAENKDAENKVKIYPNPATDEIKITATEKIRSVGVLNAVGQVVTPPNLPEWEEVICDISLLPVGVYFVQVNGVYVGRFVKE